MTLTLDTRLAELQRAAQLKLGGCLLRLQQYELLLKALVANTDLAGEPAQLQALRDAQVASVHKTTLGGLVSLFTGGYLCAGDESAPTPETDVKFHRAKPTPSGAGTISSSFFIRSTPHMAVCRRTGERRKATTITMKSASC
ncbi:MAG: hypothetical protein QM749_13195 [Aquabacterium sp.]